MKPIFQIFCFLLAFGCAEVDVGKEKTADVDSSSEEESETGSDVDGDSDGDSDGDTDGDADSDTAVVADSDSDSDLPSDTDGDTETFSDTESNLTTDSNGDTDVDTNTASDTGEACPGIQIGETCFFLVDTSERTKTEAIVACGKLGAAWNLCKKNEICQSAVYTYMSESGCDCDGGGAKCNCKWNNLYFHALDTTKSVYLTVNQVTNCTGDSVCLESSDVVCGAVICCS